MKLFIIILSIWNNYLKKFWLANESFIIMFFITIISFIYLTRKCQKKEGKKNLFKLEPSLEEEMKNFKLKKTKLIFHFFRVSDKNRVYNKLHFYSQKKSYDIIEGDLILEFNDIKYPYKYNIAEKIFLLGDNCPSKIFIIMINKNVENHYNVILDIFNEKKTFSLEAIIYSSLKKYLEQFLGIEQLKIYVKENFLSKILRFNIINARENDLINIYYFDNGRRKKAKLDKDIFSKCKENLLLNFIYSKDGNVAYKRIYDNNDESDIKPFTEGEINLLNNLYKNVIKKYINSDLCNIKNIKNLKKEFTEFDKNHGYKVVVLDNEKNIKDYVSDLRTLNRKFINTPFYIRNYTKDDIPLEDLNNTEYLCYLNILLMNDDFFLDRIQSLNEEKNLIFNKYSFLSNKDKSLILVNLLQNTKKDKSNYTFRHFYDLPENSCYIESESFFRKTISNLNDDSSLSFFYLQLNSGSGVDYNTKAEHYKIRMIPLIEIKYHLLIEFFYPYFFTYDSNNNVLAFNNVDTQILSFNEAKEIGYVKSKKLSEISDQNNMIKLAFLKFHEHAHIKFKGDYDDKFDPIYLLDSEFKEIDNKRQSKNNTDQIISNVGESGNALEFFVFNDLTILNKLIKSKEDLSKLNDINLLIGDNFKDLRKYAEELTKNVTLISIYDGAEELSKKYEEKIKIQNSILKDKDISDLRLHDLDIHELYKI